MWNLDAPPGFRGLRDDEPVVMYVRHLPHWRQAGATYFGTYRLGDSLPQATLRELAAWRAEWERKHPPPRSDEVWEEYARQGMRWAEDALDQGKPVAFAERPARRHSLRAQPQVFASLTAAVQLEWNEE